MSEKVMYYLIPDYNRPGKQRLITSHFGWLKDHITCLVGPFSHEDEAREEAHAIEIAAANKLPELDDDFFRLEGAWFGDRFVLTEAEYADLVNNREAW